MIINHEFKYIFIGIPFSGSTAISNELEELYGGQKLFHKHSNIPLLLKEMPEINIHDYYIFAVSRNPLDISFSIFNKRLSNHNGIFTDPNRFKENGGHVTKRDRRLFKKIYNKKYSFKRYLRIIHRYVLPYDSNITVNRPYIKHLIEFDNISDGFKECLLSIGITPQRDLPIANKTKKAKIDFNLSNNLLNQLYGPYILKNELDYDIVNKNRITMLSRFIFTIYSKFRALRIMKYDKFYKDNSKTWIE